MKLKDTFIVHESDEGTMLVPTGEASFSGLVRGNKTLGMILNLLQEETTEEAVLAGLKAKIKGAPEGALERDLAKALSELRKIGAVEE